MSGQTHSTEFIPSEIEGLRVSFLRGHAQRGEAEGLIFDVKMLR